MEGLRLARAGRLGFRFALGFACGLGGVASIRFKAASRRCTVSVSLSWSGSVCLGHMNDRLPGGVGRITRRLPTGQDRWAVRDYTRRVGEVVWAWNELHEAFALTFCKLVDPENFLMGMTLWVTLTSDSTQRSALEAAISASWSRVLGKRERAALRWALKQTTELSQYRNDVVHGITGWLLTEKGTRVHLAYFPNPMGRLMRYVAREDAEGNIQQGPDLHKLTPKLRGDLMQLAGYVRSIALSLREQPRPQLPRRPKLQLPPYVRGVRGQTRRQKRAKARRARPRPSSG